MSIKSKVEDLIKKELADLTLKQEEGDKGLDSFDRNWILAVYKEFKEEDVVHEDPFENVPEKVLKDLINKGYLKDRDPPAEKPKKKRSKKEEQ